jgi:hypothetical protein
MELNRSVRAALLCVSALLGAAGLARAQESPAPAAPPDTLRVVLHCDQCDLVFLKTNVGFAEFVSETETAEVDVTVSAPAAGDTEWRLAFAGRGRFSGRERSFTFRATGSAATDETRRELTRWLKIGLAEYAVDTRAGSQLDVTFDRPATSPGAPANRDRWNYWVFRLGLDSFGNGEQSTVSRSYYVNTSANRTTENWKIRIGGYRSINWNSFDLGDGEKVESHVSDWSADTLIVKSLTGHLSAALTGSVTGSTFSNEERVGQIAPGIEYDFFPYSESTKRSLTIQYTVGGAFYNYEAETIFGKMTEKIAKHTVSTSLGLSQPWGQAGGSFIFTQQLSALERTRLTFSGSVRVRLTRNLTVNASGSYDRIRDQFTLEKGEASEEEVLLRQRQLATGHRYRFSFGFQFSFGALSNITVNPRFSL